MMEKDTRCPTPHIAAQRSEIAKTVLMPGDPLRSKYIAENFLDDARLVNNVRGIHGYTGTYKGVPVTVMASGMGMPSMAIYSYELFNFYDVDNIFRIGSAGALVPEVNLRDLVFGMAASTDSNYGAQYALAGAYAPHCDFSLLETAVATARECGVPYHVGGILSSDRFYNEDNAVNDGWAKMGVLAVEMESAALYMNAARAGKRALAVCTVSDQLVRQEFLSTEERQVGFTAMMKVALETVTKI